jgi:hypothetical protein
MAKKRYRNGGEICDWKSNARYTFSQSSKVTQEDWDRIFKKESAEYIKSNEPDSLFDFVTLGK